MGKPSPCRLPVSARAPMDLDGPDEEAHPRANVRQSRVANNDAVFIGNDYVDRPLAATVAA